MISEAQHDILWLARTTYSIDDIGREWWIIRGGGALIMRKPPVLMQSDDRRRQSIRILGPDWAIFWISRRSPKRLMGNRESAEAFIVEFLLRYGS